MAVRDGVAAAASCIDGGGRTGAPHLQIRIGRKAYGEGGHLQVVLQDLHFDVAAGEVLGVLGPSGCGKSTLLRLVAGLESSFAGQISFDGLPIDGPTPAIGLVFQEARLLPWLRVASNVAFALPAETPTTARAARVDAAISLVGLGDRGHLWPRQLSGGMEKRVGLARALAASPRVLLMDEPFAALDLTSKIDIQDKIAAIQARQRLTMVLVTHDIDEALYLSDRILLLGTHPASIRGEYAVPAQRPRRRVCSEATDLKARIVEDIMKLMHANRTGGPHVVA